MKFQIQRLVILISVFLLFISIILNFFVFQKTQEGEFVEDIQQRIQNVEKLMDQDFVQIVMEIRPNDSLSFEKISVQKTVNPFYILSSAGKLLFWSDFSFIMDFSSLDLKKEFQIVKDDPYGTFLVKTRKVKRNRSDYYFIQAYRLIWPGTFENDYLKTGPNPEIFGNDQFEIFTNPQDGDFQIIGISGNPLFGINFKLGFESVRRVSNTPLLIFISSLALLYFLLSFDFLRKKWKNGFPWQTIFYGFLILAFIRIGMLWFDLPGLFFDLPLFNPANYASSWLNPSLGDLALNTICFGFISGLVIYQLSSSSTTRKFHEKYISNNSQWSISAVFVIPTIFFFVIWYLTRDLTLNSQWFLDISSIPSFDWFKGLSFFILFLWGSLYVLLSLTLISLLLKNQLSKSRLYTILFWVSFVFTGLFFYFNFWLSIASLVHFLFLFSIIRFELFKNVFSLGLDTFLTSFYACLIAAMITGLSTFHSENERLVQSKRNFANQNLIEKDVMTEFFLGEIFTRLKNDVFIQNRLVDPLLSKDPIETKIRKIYLDNYFDQFEVVIRIFSGSSSQILGPSEGSSLTSLRQSFMKSDFATGVKDLYFIRRIENRFGNKFVAFVPIIRENNLLGTIYLELDQLQIQPGSVYPKLLLDKKYSSKLNPITFDYAVFKDGNLIRSLGEFNYNQSDFQKEFERKSFFQVGLSDLGFHHLGIKNNNEILIISSPILPVSHFFGNISLFFVVFVFLTFFTILVFTLFNGYEKFEFNYSTKLQLYLNFAFFFPIIIISVITIGLLSASYRDDLNRQYVQKARLIQSNLESFYSDQNGIDFDLNSLEEEVNSLAKTIAGEIHLYSRDGFYQASNRSNIFEKKILGPQINPNALSEIKEKKRTQLIVREQIGKLNYQCVYLGVYSKTDQSLLAILGVPFFESETELNSLISDVLSNIFNAFVVIFIVFLIVSFFVSKNLTLPFRLLTQKLKSTNLENNEPMNWASKDEIGLLVKEYNNMLYKLEASKKVLASTEKESAWREMAKQVAHEIKNPLTPMKLMLQHLLRLGKEGKLEDQEKLKKSFETLIHQVDALSGIASSFSTFAKMPLPKNELMNFKLVLTKVLDLFKNDKRLILDVKDDSYTEEIQILGDESLFGRIISNLIINGIQAVTPGKTPHVKIWLWMTEEAVFLEIIDNGKGIPVEFRDKIFIPNFSTKSQGSGLGLAIAKSGVETAGGKIWFDTEIGKGTTFYLTFPLVQ